MRERGKERRVGYVFVMLCNIFVNQYCIKRGRGREEEGVGEKGRKGEGGGAEKGYMNSRLF